VEIVKGDVTRSPTLRPALRGVDHVIFTAGVHSGRLAPESLVKATDYQGVLDTMEAAKLEGFRGRFVYLNSIGIMGNPSWAARLLNFLKRNTLYWRLRLEPEIRRSGLDYTIIRVGFLTNHAGGGRQVKVCQQDLPLVPSNKICREDVAEAFIEAMRHPKASCATFDIVWDKGPRHTSLNALYSQLQPDNLKLSASGALDSE
jgi:uncharacterized protein YbjT (DUF2867 family)